MGHSWGGLVVTHAGVNAKVKSLVCVAAFAPDVGDSVCSLLQAYPAARMQAQTTSAAASHLVILSQPAEAVQAILAALRAP